MKEAKLLKKLRSTLLTAQLEVDLWSTDERKEAHTQSKAHLWLNRSWTNIDQMLEDSRACLSLMAELTYVLERQKRNTDSIPSGAWNNYGRG